MNGQSYHWRPRSMFERIDSWLYYQRNRFLRFLVILSLLAGGTFAAVACVYGIVWMADNFGMFTSVAACMAALYVFMAWVMSA